tara:strand:- start:771 stop:1019 length:249 start_codon:yes stop_codon:yes gene_type:complete
MTIRQGRLPSPPNSYDQRWANQLVRQLESNISATNLAASSSRYTVTNVTTDRALDADSTSTAELADVLGTLITDLRERGVIG